MMSYIDTKYLGKCETCRHHRSGTCNTFCDCGEEYSPDLSKIPTADVVPKSEAERWRRNLEAVLKEIPETKREVAREIFEAINEDCFDQFGYFEYEAYAELKKKYTEKLK